ATACRSCCRKRPASSPMSTRDPDFGSTPRRYGMPVVLVTVMALGAAAAFFGYDLLRARSGNIATAQAWDIKGPPCAQLTLDQWNTKHLKVRDVTNYDGRIIGRWS